MNTPIVAVGILSDKTINFSFTGIYSTSDTNVVTDGQTASLSESGLAIAWNGNLYNELEFTPTSYQGDSFELEGVTIGVDFHWQRKENQRFQGSLKLIADNGKITAINLIGVEEYLVSVISSEMRDTSSLPLLRAHSVISRSWLLRQIQEKSKKPFRAPEKSTDDESEIIRWWDHEDHSLFDVCADDHCQRYQGIMRISSNVATGAVKDTKGEVLMYDGKICDARFSKCCGGAFERFESCWDDTPHPYLVSSRDTVENTVLPDLTTEEEARKWIMSSPRAFCNTTDRAVLADVLNRYDLERGDFFRWKEHYTRRELSEIVESRSSLGVGEIIDMYALERGCSGRIIKLHIIGSKRSVTIGKELMIRRTLSRSHLLSSAFIVEKHFGENNTIPESFTLHGAGWGHGVGLCQIGAAVMGEKGFDYKEILRHYYPSTSTVKIY